MIVDRIGKLRYYQNMLKNFEINSAEVLKNEFGKCIKEERNLLGFSLEKLALKLNVTKGYLSRLEQGKSKPSLKMINHLSRILKIDGNSLSLRAGYIPKDVKDIFYKHPEEAPALLRESFQETQATFGVEKTSADPIKKIPLSKLKNLYSILNVDCSDWLDQRAPNSIHAVVTDPPYGLKEYSSEEKKKLRNGKGGVWRIPPSFDGSVRSPLPRFTILDEDEKLKLKEYFQKWALKIIRVLVPGGHVFIATNPLLSHYVYMALIEAGFEKRGEIIRLVQTLRGGDRPKNAHEEFENVTVMPRSCWEPWGLFRKPCEGRVQDSLRKWKTGGLRRVSTDQPFCDVIKSSPTRGTERKISNHPSLKPQAFMRQVVRAALPLGEGVILDPFMGGGSTIAAAAANNYQSIGLELDKEFYNLSMKAIPKLATLDVSEKRGTSGIIQFAQQQSFLEN
jgi:DNA modification methylase/DNA-binding XRE family transcriptional regulator